MPGFRRTKAEHERVMRVIHARLQAGERLVKVAEEERANPKTYRKWLAQQEGGEPAPVAERVKRKYTKRNQAPVIRQVDLNSIVTPQESQQVTAVVLRGNSASIMELVKNLGSTNAW